MLLAILLSWPAAASAECPRGLPASAFAPGDGSRLATTGACDAFVFTGNAATSPWSWGDAVLREAVPEAYRLTVRMRPLSGVRTLEIAVPGGVVMLHQGGFGFYESEQQFAATGWQALAGYSMHAEHVIAVRHQGRRVELTIDGTIVGETTFADRPTGRNLRLGAKGYGGMRPRVLVRGVRVEPLQ